MTRTAIDQQLHPLLMLPEQRLIDAICDLTNQYASAAAQPGGMVERDSYSDRISAFQALADHLGMSDEFSWMLRNAAYAAFDGRAIEPISFSLLADDEDDAE